MAVKAGSGVAPHGRNIRHYAGHRRNAQVAQCSKKAAAAKRSGAGLARGHKKTASELAVFLARRGRAAKRTGSVHLLRQHLHAQALAQTCFGGLLLALALGRRLLVSGAALEFNDQASLQNGATETPHRNFNGLTGFQDDLSQFSPLGDCRKERLVHTGGNCGRRSDWYCTPG